MYPLNADMPYASLAVRRQALSKRATYTGATADASATDSSLLDSATGAFVHGSEDDVEKVRLTINCAPAGDVHHQCNRQGEPHIRRQRALPSAVQCFCWTASICDGELFPSNYCQSG